MRQLQNDPEKIRSFYQNHRSNMPSDIAFTYGPINNVKGYKEFESEHRPEGWNVWLTFALTPAQQTSTASMTPTTRMYTK